MTDPIADFLTRIRNALLAKHQQLEIPASKLKVQLTRILQQEGYIEGFKIVEASPRNIIRVLLKYGPEGERIINGLGQVSKPGRRVYCSKDEIPRVLGGLGIAILSTSKGLMTGQEGTRQGVGGEVVCTVW